MECRNKRRAKTALGAGGIVASQWPHQCCSGKEKGNFPPHRPSFSPRGTGESGYRARHLCPRLIGLFPNNLSDTPNCHVPLAPAIPSMSTLSAPSGTVH
ncbi:hypothetical protein ACOMHN_003118 [Nucella lapillus]